jgi:hypothetical protein
MSKWYAEIKGNRGLASRQGTVKSGIWSHTRTWDIGIEVTCGDEDDKDAIYVQLTYGSNGYSRRANFVPSTVIVIRDGKLDYVADKDAITIKDEESL